MEDKIYGAGRARADSLSSNSASISGDSYRDSLKVTKCVRFNPIVKVAMLPLSERVEARRARAGLWRPAPMSDELWDGEFMKFRAMELTPDAFKALLNSDKRRKSPMPRSFASMFSLATSASSKDGKLAGVDIVHARARVFAEDFDEEERDSNGRLDTDSLDLDDVNEEDDFESEACHIVLKLSAEELGNGEIVLRLEPATDSARAPPPPPPPSSAKHPSNEKVTHFTPSRPADPSPSERAGLILAAQPTFAASSIRKKTSTASNSTVTTSTTTSSFQCGEGKRATVFLGEAPIRDEVEQWNNEPNADGAPSKPKRKKSFLGMVFKSLTLSAAT